MAQIVEQVTDRYDAVVGVDTHTDTHTAAVLDRFGAVLAQITVATDPDGLSRLLAWAAAHTPRHGRRLWAVEGTRAHGHGLSRLLTAAGEPSARHPNPPPAARRRGGKSDTLDAVDAARAVLACHRPRRRAPQPTDHREALRILLVCRRHHSDTRTATVNLFKVADPDRRRRPAPRPTRAVHHPPDPPTWPPSTHPRAPTCPPRNTSAAANWAPSPVTSTPSTPH